MKRLFVTLTFLALCLSCAKPSYQAVFEGDRAEKRWTLRELNAELPADWTGYNYLVLEMKASSPQRFYLSLISGQLEQRREVLPLPGVWIRAAVPLQYYRAPNRAGHDLASVGKVARNSFWIGTGGAYGPLNAVDAIGVAMVKPHGNPTLEIRSVTLAKEDPGSDVLDKKPVVDEFGQWIPAEWDAKVRSLEDATKVWRAEEAALKGGDFGFSRYGGYAHTQVKATGFFRVEEVDGRWWFVDPEGHLFFSTSSNVVGPHGGDSRLERRADYFAAMPPVMEGRQPGTTRPMGFHAWNLQRRHGEDWQAKWRDLTVKRMDDWGLNTVGNWSDPRLWDMQKKAYFVNLRGWGMEQGYLGMPDVYSEDWPKLVEQAAAEQCGPRKNDPYLLGYFVANEPPWPGRESLVVDSILDSPPSAIQREAKAFLAEGDTPERRKAFIYRAFERYLEVINAAIKRHDPNHLNLGLRFGGEVPPMEMLRASKAFDVYSLNVYSTHVNRKVLEEIYAEIARPILVGEFHFGVPGRGLAAGLVQVRDQAERGVAYRYYVEQAASFPAFIGTSWFQWVDQPVTGRMDGENYNIGLVDVTDRPYTELIDALKTTHRRLFDVHSGKVAPFDRLPQAQ